MPFIKPNWVYTLTSDSIVFGPIKDLRSRTVGSAPSVGIATTLPPSFFAGGRERLISARDNGCQVDPKRDQVVFVPGELMIDPEDALGKASRKDRYWNPVRRGSPGFYAQFARSTKRFGSSLFITTFSGYSPASLGLQSKHQNGDMSDILGVGGIIAILSPTSRVAAEASENSRQWQEYLRPFATAVASIRFPAFIQRGRAFDIYLRLLNQRYADYGTWRGHRLQKLHKRVVPHLDAGSRLLALRRHLEALHLKLAENDPAAVNAARTEILRSLAEEEADERAERYRFRFRDDDFEANDVLPTHDRTARAAARTSTARDEQVAQILSGWERFLPSKVESELNQRLRARFVRRNERTQLPEHLADTLQQMPASTQKVYDELRGETDRILTAAGDQSPAALSDRVTALCREHDALFTKLKRALPPCATGREAYDRQSARFRTMAARKLQLGDAVLNLWVVTKPTKGASVDLPLKAPLQLQVNAAQEIGKALASDEAKQLAETLRIADGANRQLEYVWGPNVPDLADLVARPLSELAAPTIAIGSKLQPSFSGGSEAYLLFDGCQEVYNPPLGRRTSLRRALLEKTTIIAQGADYVRSELTNYGYCVDIPAPVLNQIGRLKARSDRNSLPLMPVLPHDLPAYIPYGPAIAQVSIWNPDGTPIWIAGKTYTITPGWSRRNVRINSEEVLVQDRINGADSVARNIEGLRPATDDTYINIGTSHWDVTTESRPIRIREDDTTEEREMTVSAALNREIVETLLANNPNARPAAVAARAEPETAVVTVDPSVLQQLSPEEYATMTAIAHAVAMGGASTDPDAAPAAKPKPPEWPTWAPSLEEFLAAFPAPKPPSVQELYPEVLTASMQRIMDRFGPRYTTDNASNVVPLGPSAEVEEKAFAMWATAHAGELTEAS